MSVSWKTKDLRYTEIIQRGVASMQSDLPARSSMVRAVEGCCAIYPATGQHRRLILAARGRYAAVGSVVLFTVAHLVWANAPLPPPRPPVVDVPSSPFAEWLKADASIVVPPTCTLWSLTGFGYQTGVSIGDAMKQNESLHINHAATTQTARQITRFVAANHRFYQLMDHSLLQPWRQVLPGTVEVQSESHPLWVVYDQSPGPDLTEVQVPFAKSLILTPVYSGTLTGGSRLDPQTEIREVVPLLDGALWARAYTAVLKRRYNAAASYSVQRLRITANCLRTPRNGLDSYDVYSVIPALHDLYELAPKVTVNEAKFVSKSLAHIDRSIPSMKALMEGDMVNNRWRLQQYLAQNTLTPMNIWAAIHMESFISRNSTPDSPGSLLLKPILDPLVLSKRRILADYDYNVTALQHYNGSLDLRLNSQGLLVRSVMPNFRRTDPVALLAYDPYNGALLQQEVHGFHRWMSFYAVAFAVNAYAAVKGHLPQTLTELYPRFLTGTFKKGLYYLDPKSVPVLYRLAPGGRHAYDVISGTKIPWNNYKATKLASGGSRVPHTRNAQRNTDGNSR